MCRAGCDSGVWESVVSSSIIVGIIVVIGIIIIWIIVVIIVRRGGCIICRRVHGRGGCWFFRGDSCHPRVDLFDCHGAGSCWELVVVSWL